MRAPIGTVAAIALSAGVGALAATTTHAGHRVNALSPTSRAAVSEVKGSVPNLPACAQRASSTLAYLAIEKSGSTSASTSEMNASGLMVSQPQSTSAGNVVVVGPQTSAGAPVSSSQISAEPGVQGVAPLAAQSSNPAYNSCLQDLSDSTADRQLKADVKPAIESQAGISAAALDDALWTVSDDPLQPNTEVVTAQIQGPPLPSIPGQPSSVTIYSVKPYLAFVNTSTNTVTGVVVGPWNK